MRRVLRWVLEGGPVVVGGTLILAAVLWVGWVLSLSQPRQASASDLAQFFLALVSTLVVVGELVVRWWQVRRVRKVSTPEQVEAALTSLAERLLVTWGEQVVRRGIEIPAPVGVRWAWTSADAGPSREELNAFAALPTDPVPLPGTPGPSEIMDSGAVADLHDEVYARLRHGQLVIAGPAGAGKTGAMMMLLLAILRHRKCQPPHLRAGVPVPLWLTISTWDPRRQGLREWVAGEVRRDHPYLRARDFGPDAVRRMIDDRRVTLLLDGLDEMSTPLRATALERLHREACGLRIVLTSRREQFVEACAEGELLQAAVIEVQPVPPPVAREYLLSGLSRRSRRRWQQLADHLVAHPHSVPARVLNSPLTLSLARAAYARRDPAELYSGRFRAARDLRQHLLDQVLVEAYPGQAERERATRTLEWIAHCMGPSRALAWWRIPRWVPQRHRGSVCGLLVSAGCLVVFAALYGWATGLVPALGVGTVAGLRTGREKPRMLLPRWPAPSDLRWILRGGIRTGLLVALVVGVGDGLACGPRYGVENGLLVGSVVAPVGGLLHLWAVPLPDISDSSPMSVYRKDVRAQLVAVLVVGVLGGLIGAGLGPLFDFSSGPLEGVAAHGPGPRAAIGAVIGPAFALLLGMVLGVVPGASWGLIVTELALRVRGRGSIRFLPLLESALNRQVLRQAGAVYQFRHADLQDLLAGRHRRRHPRRPEGVGSLPPRKTQRETVGELLGGLPGRSSAGRSSAGRSSAERRGGPFTVDVTGRGGRTAAAASDAAPGAVPRPGRFRPGR